MNKWVKVQSILHNNIKQFEDKRVRQQKMKVTNNISMNSLIHDDSLPNIKLRETPSFDKVINNNNNIINSL